MKGRPTIRAALIAMTEVMKFLRSNKKLERIVLCCFDEEMAMHYEAAFDELGGQ